MVSNGISKVLGDFYCESCDYNTSNKSNYEKHLLTVKHKSNESNKKVSEQENSYYKMLLW